MNPQKRFHDTPRYFRWLELFLDRKNTHGLDTYRNQTLAACHAYGYNSYDRKSYLVAAQIGHRNVNKYKQTISIYYEMRGITYGYILDLYLKFMIARKDINMLYSLAEDLGYPLPPYKNVTNPKSYICSSCLARNTNNFQTSNEDIIIRLGDEA